MPIAKPMRAPCAPPINPPMITRSPPRKASRTTVLNMFFTYLTVTPISEKSLLAPWTDERFHKPRAGRRSVVVARVDVDAGDALGVEHGHVAAVVLERQAQVEAVAAQVLDRLPLEAAGRGVVAPLPHDQQVPPQAVALEPGQRLGPDPQRPGREQHDPVAGVEDLQQPGHLVDQRVVAARLEERLPVPPGVLEEMLAGGGFGQDAVHVEHDRGPRGDRPVAPLSMLGSLDLGTHLVGSQPDPSPKGVITA